MNCVAHIFFGTTAGVGFMVLVEKYGFHPEPFPFITACMTGCIFPDIDTPKSYIGRRIPILPKLLFKTVGHRTLTHSILFTLIVSGLLYRTNSSAGIGLCLGISSHIFADAMMPFSKGVSLFYPISKHKIGFMKR